MLSRLPLLGDTCLEFTLRRGNHKDGAISLGGSCDHVFDKVSVAWGINYGEVVFRGFELPEGDINGDTTFSFTLEFVHNPSIFEGSFTKLGGFFLIFLKCSFINTTTFIDEVASGCRFS
jgi:hypothetical protein